MKILHKPVLLMLFCLAGCQSRQEAGQAYQAEMTLRADTTLESDAHSMEAPAATGSPASETKLPARQFVRSADVKCRVDDVVEATHRIEAITAQHGGFVTYTKLDSQQDGTETVAISADSLLETTRYTVSNTITLRVPNARLDTTLRAITELANHLDFREIKADDVALQRLAAAQARQRNRAYDQRLRTAIDRQGRRLGDINDTEENRLNHQQQTDEARINDLTLADQLQFSSITLNVYQRQTIQRTVLPSLTNVQAYEPGFLTKAADALAAGAHVLENFVLLLLEGWGVILFCFGAYILFRYVSGRLKRA